MDTYSTEEAGGKICLACGLQFESHARFCSQCGGGLVERLEDPLLGKVWGDRYEILAVLGKGGMGIVYKARHQLLERPVAIKTLHPSMVSNHQNLARFQREAKAASSLNHPQIVSVHDFGMSPNGVPYLVMDYLDGRSLASVIEQGGFLAPARALPIFIQVCEALNHAHKRGVVHRDLKPSNIMLVETDDEADSVRLLDFGLAKLLAQPGKLLQRLSSTNDTFGSPLYMSPEHCMGHELDGRADLYALGCVMYETLTGTPPLKDDNALGTIYKQISETPISLCSLRPDLTLSKELEGIVMKTLEKDPQRRHASAAEVRSDLQKELKSLKAGASADKRSEADGTDKLEAQGSDEAPSELSEDDSQPVADSVASADDAQSALDSEPSPSGKVTGDFWSSSPDDPCNIRSHADDQTYKSDVVAAQEQQFLWQLKNEELVYGPDGRSLLEIVKNLADLYNKQRRYAEAKPLYERLAALITKWKEPKSVDMHDVWLNLGDMCIELQQCDQAKIHYESARTAVQECYGEDHPEVARVLRSLSYLARVLGDSIEALEYLNGALRVLEACFGPSNPMLADTLGRMAFIYCLDERDFAEAHRLYDRAIALIEAASGQDDLDLAKHLLGKADVYLEECMYDEARECCLKARAIQERLFGPNHETVASTLDRLAWMYYLQEDYSKAVEHYTQVLHMQEGLAESHEAEIVTTLLSLAFACRAAGRIAVAEQHCLRAVEICDRVYGREHIETTRALMELGYAYRSQGRFGEAADAYGQALKIREAVWGGRNHSSVADSLEALAWLKNDMAEFDEAEQNCLEAIGIMESMPYASKWTLASRLRWLSNLCESMGKQQEAKSHRARAEQIEGAEDMSDEPPGER